jgi:Protein of unknown function (DUF4246)
MKILTLFLVDPHIKIISSANVPCQQRQWWAQEIRGQDLLRSLPAEVYNEVIHNVERFPIGIREAKELRLELMTERKILSQANARKFESTKFRF